MYKRLILLLIGCLSAVLCQAQDNVETVGSEPTGYVKAVNPYTFGSIDGVLYVFRGVEPHILVRFPVADTRESFSIPSTVVRIARGAFKDCRNLIELVIPSSVHFIGENAFDNSGITSFRVAGNDIAATYSPPTYSPPLETGENTLYYNLAGNVSAIPTAGINIEVKNGVATKVLR